MSANGVINLSIPIESISGVKTPLIDICISDHGNWRHLHWNALISAYNSTPFFEYYCDDFYSFYQKRYKYLFDFNQELVFLLCNLLNLDCSRVHTSSSYIVADVEDLDFRQIINPKVCLSIDDYFKPSPYYQVFDHRFPFQENLSIVDLLFNMGNESLIILNESIKKTS